MSELNSSEALIISGETKKGIFTLNNQKINCIGDNADGLWHLALFIRPDDVQFHASIIE